MGLKNKDLILNLLEKDLLSHGVGLSTIEISKQLYMQRTNVSKLLNELVEEGLVIKKGNNRPVLYTRNRDTFDQYLNNPFEELIGAHGSLDKAVHLAKAAVTYPNKGLNVLISGSDGSGKTFFAKKICDYASQNDSSLKNSGFLRLNCRDYINNEEQLYERFSQDLKEAENRYFLIDNVQYLDPRSQALLMPLLSNGYLLQDEKRTNTRTVIICTMDQDTGADEFLDTVRDRFAISIQLPSLAVRGLKERFELIQLFLRHEAVDSDSTIAINTEIFIALLLYNAEGNIKELKADIKQACASAFAREYHTENKTITLMIQDFPQRVRSGLLNYKVMRNEVDQIIDQEAEYVIDKDSSSTIVSKKTKNSIYEWIGRKNSELTSRGFSLNEISAIVNVGIENQFRNYRENPGSSMNKQQLQQLVDEDIILSVEDLLNEASRKLNRYYSSSIFVGLCLHLQSIIDGRGKPGSVRIERIMEFIENHKSEYAIASRFCEDFAVRYKITSSIDETVLVAMFLQDTNQKREEQEHPSLLLAMHGDNVAKSLAETVNAFSNSQVYYFDLPLSRKPLDAYEQIRKTILNIPHEKGVLVLFDMGSFRDIFNMVAIETGIQLRMIQLPFTLVVMDAWRKLMMSGHVDEAYEQIAERLKNTPIFDEEVNDAVKDLNKIKTIISVCLTGEGGALQIKHYLENNFDLGDVQVLALQVRKQNDFILELNQLSKDRKILCIIGTFNPNVFGIPFIPIENVFNPAYKDISNLLQKDNIEMQTFINNSRIIMEHLRKDLINIDAQKARDLTVEFISQIESSYEEKIELNEKIGLLVHIMCSISRSVEGRNDVINPYEDEVIQKNMMLYRIIEEAIVKIEIAFDIKFSRSEIANIICIIKQSKSG